MLRLSPLGGFLALAGLEPLKEYLDDCNSAFLRSTPTTVHVPLLHLPPHELMAA